MCTINVNAKKAIEFFSQKFAFFLIYYYLLTVPGDPISFSSFRSFRHGSCGCCVPAVTSANPYRVVVPKVSLGSARGEERGSASEVAEGCPGSFPGTC